MIGLGVGIDYGAVHRHPAPAQLRDGMDPPSPRARHRDGRRRRRVRRQHRDHRAALAAGRRHPDRHHARLHVGDRRRSSRCSPRSRCCRRCSACSGRRIDSLHAARAARRARPRKPHGWHRWAELRQRHPWPAIVAALVDPARARGPGALPRARPDRRRRAAEDTADPRVLRRASPPASAPGSTARCWSPSTCEAGEERPGASSTAPAEAAAGRSSQQVVAGASSRQQAPHARQQQAQTSRSSSRRLPRVDGLRPAPPDLHTDMAKTTASSRSPSRWSTTRHAAVYTVISDYRAVRRGDDDLVDDLRDNVIPKATKGQDMTAYVGGSTAGYIDLADADHRQAAAGDRPRPAALVLAADARVPLDARAAQGRRHQPALDRRGVRRRHASSSARLDGAARRAGRRRPDRLASSR